MSIPSTNEFVGVCRKLAVHLSLYNLFVFLSNLYRQMVSTWIFYCIRNNLPAFSDVLRQMAATRKLYGNTSIGNNAGKYRLTDFESTVNGKA